jgi:hypothetical protein
MHYKHQKHHIHYKHHLLNASHTSSVIICITYFICDHMHHIHHMWSYVSHTSYALQTTFMHFIYISCVYKYLYMLLSELTPAQCSRWPSPPTATSAFPAASTRPFDAGTCPAQTSILTIHLVSRTRVRIYNNSFSSWLTYRPNKREC